MNKPLESVYWAYTRACNQECPHCYNRSGPGGESVSAMDAKAVVANLPERVNRVALGGGEPLVDMELTLSVIGAIRQKYGRRAFIALQTNGDMATGDSVRELISAGVRHISVSSMDELHELDGETIEEKRDRLEELFKKCGMRFLPISFDSMPRYRAFVHRRVNEWLEVMGFEHYNGPELSYAFWGATPEMWLKGNWPRGRAIDNGLWRRDPRHNFCDIWSGGACFLKKGSPYQEVAIHLTELHPCCPGVAKPLGDLRRETLEDILIRAAEDPAWRAIDRGDPAMMGEEYGVPRRIAIERISELGSVCLWCDEFFAKHHGG